MQFEDLKDPNKLNTDDIVIAIMGPTGVGKSNIIDKLTGQEKRTGHGLVSHTGVVGAVRIRGHSKFLDQIVLVDTPGFDDTTKSDEQILEIIANWLVTTYKAKVFIYGIIYVQRITDIRMPGSHLRNLRMLGDLCGKAISGLKVLYVTTMWDAIEDKNIGEEREADLKNKHWKALGLGDYSARFNDTQESAWNIIETMLLRRPTLQLQEEMCKDKIIFRDTKAARGLYMPLPSTEDENDKGNDKGKGQKQSRRMPWGALTGRTPEFQIGDIVILVMGDVGAGKSTFINTLLAEERMAVSDNLRHRYTKIEVASVDPLSGSLDFQGSRLVILEIPGFNDRYREDAQILWDTADWLASAHRQKMVLGGVIYLYDICQNRASGHYRRYLEIYKSLWGEKAYKKVVIVPTAWARLVSEKDGNNRERESMGNDWKDMIERGSVVRRFQDNRESAWRIVETTLRYMRQPVLKDIPLQIQTDLVVKNINALDTKAADLLRQTAMEIVRQKDRRTISHEEMRNPRLRYLFEQERKAIDTAIKELGFRNNPRWWGVPLLAKVQNKWDSYY